MKCRSAFALTAAALLASCGSDSAAPAPAAPAVVVVATPTPAANPTVGAFGCPLPSLPDLKNECPKLSPEYSDIVNAAIDKTVEAATDAYRSVSQGASEVAEQVRKRTRRMPSPPPVPESFVPIEAAGDRPAPSVSAGITVVEVVTRIEPAEDVPPRK